MLAFVSVPHRHKPHLRTFDTSEEFLSYVNGYCATTGRECPDDVTEAAFVLGDDLSYWHFLESQADVDAAVRSILNGDSRAAHQAASVLTILNDLRPQYSA